MSYRELRILIELELSPPQSPYIVYNIIYSIKYSFQELDVLLLTLRTLDTDILCTFETSGYMVLYKLIYLLTYFITYLIGRMHYETSKLEENIRIQHEVEL